MSSDTGIHAVRPGLSVVIPAYNEIGYLGATLQHLQAAAAVLADRGGPQIEIIVVDNGSTDGTAALAVGPGVRVVSETVRNIARVRNTGARAGRRVSFRPLLHG